MNNKKVLVYVFSWLAVILTMLTIVKFSLENGQESSQTSDGIVDVIVELSPNKENITPEQKDSIGVSIRQLGHFSIYLLLGLSLANAFRAMFTKIMPYPLLLAIAVSLQFSLFDEFVIQANTNGRAAEFRDIFTDFLGALCGVLILDFILLAISAIHNNIKRRKS